MKPISDRHTWALALRAILTDGPMCYSDLVYRLQTTVRTVYRAAKKLEEAGLATRRYSSLTGQTLLTPTARARRRIRDFV